MRRTLGLAIVGAAMLLVGGPAEAGLRAVYADARQGRQLQIEVGDNGDARISEADSEDYGLLIGTDFYIVDVEEGKPTVARLKDVADAIDQVLPPVFKGLFALDTTARPKAGLRIEAGEAGEAGGRRGRTFHVRGLDSTQPDKPAVYLISDDPELRPVGAVLEHFMNAAMVPAAPLIGAEATGLIAETRTIFALGTPIVIDGRFRLEQASAASIAAERLRLPGPPQSVEALVAAMRASMPAQ